MRVIAAIAEDAFSSGKVCTEILPLFSISAGLIWDLPDLLLPELDPRDDDPEGLAGEAAPPLRCDLPLESLRPAAGDPPRRWLNLHSLPFLQLPAL